jgi:putative membrane protein
MAEVQKVETPSAETQAAEKDPRVYFAAERTLLAWIRTGLALMGLGFAIARFGLFLRQVQISAPYHPAAFAGSTFTGISLIVLGVLVQGAGAVGYARTIRDLRAGEWIAGRVSRTALTLAVALAVVGIVMAVRLFLIQ